MTKEILLFQMILTFPSHLFWETTAFKYIRGFVNWKSINIEVMLDHATKP